MLDISVIVPLYNEEESLPELADWIARVMQENHFTYEVFFCNDGSTDRSWEVICQLHDRYPQMHGMSFRTNHGKSPALHMGFGMAQGDVVITMDADLQDSPDEIPGLYKMIKDEGYDVVSGWKKKRFDPLSKTLPTKLFNATVRRASGIHNLHDFNCGLKAYRGEVVKHIELYGDMHRYIPWLAKNAGFKKIGEKVVQHQARKYGSTKFGLDRFVNGYLDLMTLWFLNRFGSKPMLIFGLWGTVVFLIGFIAVLFIAFHKIWVLQTVGSGTLITSMPSFYIALTCMLLGSQLFLAGFLGELISRTSSERNKYDVADTI